MRSLALGQLRLLIACIVLGPGLAGCLLVAARTEEGTQTPSRGAQRVTFFSSDTNGESVEQVLELSTTAVRIQVTFMAKVESGELRIEVLNGETGEVAFTVEGTKQGSTGVGIVRTTDVGDLRYRLRTTNARNGEYSISYVPPPTPTPTPLPTSTIVPTATRTATPTATEATATP